MSGVMRELTGWQSAASMQALICEWIHRVLFPASLTIGRLRSRGKLRCTSRDIGQVGEEWSMQTRCSDSHRTRATRFRKHGRCRDPETRSLPPASDISKLVKKNYREMTWKTKLGQKNHRKVWKNPEFSSCCFLWKDKCSAAFNLPRTNPSSNLIVSIT